MCHVVLWFTAERVCPVEPNSFKLLLLRKQWSIPSLVRRLLGSEDSLTSIDLHLEHQHLNLLKQRVQTEPTSLQIVVQTSRSKETILKRQC